MGQTILTADQRLILDLVMQRKGLELYYLSGGTALAEYYFSHRFSEDLDFFSSDRADPSSLRSHVDELAKAIDVREVRYERLHDRNLFFLKKGSDELKLEFTCYPFQRISPLREIDSCRIDSLSDLAANKLMAMLDRFDPKDFVDLYFILQDRSILDVRVDAERKFGVKIDPLFIGSEMAKVSRIVALPKMIIPLEIAELKKFFSAQAILLRKEILAEE